jgi:hypothetical protein
MRYRPLVLAIGMLLIARANAVSDSSPSEYEIADAYLGLREIALKVKASDAGKPNAGDSEVLAVLMETGYPEAVVSLVAIADGTTSLYFSNGGGVIGAGAASAVSRASKELASAAQGYLSQASKAESTPLPGNGRVVFYFVTPKGTFTAEGAEEELGNNRLAFSKLFHQAHEVIAAIREHSD